MTEGHIDPSRDAFEQFKSLPRDEPIQMLNLVRYRDTASYPADHENAGKGWSGADAYREYGRTSGPVLQRVGGHIIWRGRPQVTLTGPSEERWDAGFIAEYPSAAAFFEMITDEDYKAAVINRTAAVADSRLVRFGKSEGGSGFA
ncbi:DUF1330 domain-containing protein [Janibacter sp. GS2]|uniref:DUF1330 domain-containing protein n=1 Tax=Janibacter sp. GS2 TaxID=3442646 RepID=UPI003EBECFFD